MKYLVIGILILSMLAGCASGFKGSGASNPNKLEKSPCAGCFGPEEKDKLNMKDVYAS